MLLVSAVYCNYTREKKEIGKMEFRDVEICLIIPIEYNNTFFKNLGNGSILQGFRREDIQSQRFNDNGKRLFTENENKMVTCYILENKSRREIGLKQENKGYYRMKKDNVEYLFELGKIKIWFWESGKGFLTIPVTTESISQDCLINLKNILIDVRASNKFTYEVKTGKDKSDVRNNTLKDIIKKLIQMLKGVGAERNENVVKLYSLIYMLTEEEITDKENFWANLLHNSEKKQEIRQYAPEQFPYITWGIAEKCIGMVGDCAVARRISEKNENFLRENGGLRKSVFYNYLLLYLYYLGACSEHINMINKYMFSLKKIQKSFSGNLSTVEHLNDIFHEYKEILYKEVWHKTRDVEVFHGKFPGVVQNKDYNIFISYRREGGFYYARLLYEMLEKNGQVPYLDLKERESGKFDEELYKRIEQCKNMIVVLFPGCLKRCCDEEDWVRKEIVYALKHNKNMIPVMFDGFDYSEEMKELPEEMKAFRFEAEQFILSSREHFDNVVKEILRRKK